MANKHGRTPATPSMPRAAEPAPPPQPAARVEIGEASAEMEVDRVGVPLVQATAEVAVRAIELEVPMQRNPGLVHQATRMDIDLKGEEIQAARDLYDGLLASGVFAGRKDVPQKDAIKWLLRKLAAQMKASGA